MIAFGRAANLLAEQVAHDHVGDGLIGFGFAVFAVSWAWIFWTWFASAYDTDHWIYRLLTMVQMLGVLILAQGLPAMFESVVEGDHIDNKVMVLGYVVMRLPMVAQWLRASRQDPARRRSSVTMMVSIVISQVLWVVLAFLGTSVAGFFLLAIVPLLVELCGPILAEAKGTGTPWHAHHIAEVQPDDHHRSATNTTSPR